MSGPNHGQTSLPLRAASRAPASALEPDGDPALPLGEDDSRRKSGRLKPVLACGSRSMQRPQPLRLLLWICHSFLLTLPWEHRLGSARRTAHCARRPARTRSASTLSGTPSSPTDPRHPSSLSPQRAEWCRNAIKPQCARRTPSYGSQRLRESHRPCHVRRTPQGSPPVLRVGGRTGTDMDSYYDVCQTRTVRSHMC
ncbi:hypothetical protein BD413DRAFT_254265 [Trametes elegans]|nr:hypothetical protein BD413DRAFT_254265 [Trametes elegans]